MSVYTPVSDPQFVTLLQQYPLGQFVRARGIEAGIENSNYFIVTSNGEYVFTVFEKIDAATLNTYLALLQRLAANDFPCPHPVANRQQQLAGMIHNKPFTIVTRLQGSNPDTIHPAHCRAIATALAQLHSINTQGLALPLNRRGKTWRQATAKKLLPLLDEQQAELLQQELAAHAAVDESTLPGGLIHADLFPDNALFAGEQLSGVIDFYDACEGSYLYDVAITVNAWCSNPDGSLDASRYQALLFAYQQIRPFTDNEHAVWPLMLRIAAMRFWLSRLADTLLRPPQPLEKQALTHNKDPKEYQRILQHRMVTSCG